ncbi:MAG: hypothetical protein HRU51_03385 [Xanthomonadales bacterium]|nr:hypothetical protein [Xanthomonadales bacterium]
MSELEKAEKRLAQASAAVQKALRDEQQAAAAGPPPVTGPDKTPGSARGVETMFRNVYRVQMDLTSLADNKANMMISINGIIISIILAAVAPKLDSNPWLMLPTTLLLLGTMVSLVFSVLAARPRVSPKRATLDQLQHDQDSLLFFGHFSGLTENEFVRGMQELMGNRTALYEAMMRDIYGLGSVLGKKFRLLKAAYLAFMVALLTGVCAYLLVFGWLLRSAS